MELDRERAQSAALAAVCAVLFLTFLDTTIVSVTLGSVQSSLEAGVVSLQWVVNGYTLVFASLMLAAGSLGDRWGHRRVMLAGLAVFAIGSVVAATAHSPGVLIAGRVIMGFGAAGCEPGTLAVLRHVFTDDTRRTRAIGVWAAVSGLAMALGPVIGGVLVGAWSWSAVFWFNTAAAIVLLGATWRWVPDTGRETSGPVDLAGLALGAVGLSSLVYAAISGETRGYAAPEVIGLFVFGGCCLIGFWWVEQRALEPILNVRYLAAPLVRSALAVAFAVYFGIFSIFFFTALYLQEVVGYSSWRTAAVFAPMAVAIIAAALLTGGWLGRVSARVPMVGGCVVGAVGIVITRSLLGPNPGFVPLAVALAIAGIGFGAAVVPLTAAVMGAVPREHAGMAAAVTNTMRQVGAVVGVAALGALVNAHLTSGLVDRLHELGIPSTFQSIVIDYIERGQISGSQVVQAAGEFGPIVGQVLDAAYGAFRDGLGEALLVSAVLMLAAAGVTLLGARRARGRSGREDAATVDVGGHDAG